MELTPDPLSSGTECSKDDLDNVGGGATGDRYTWKNAAHDAVSGPFGWAGLVDGAVTGKQNEWSPTNTFGQRP
jgi:hypothetical protein